MPFDLIPFLLMIGNYGSLIFLAVKNYINPVKKKPEFDLYVYVATYLYVSIFAILAIPILLSIPLGSTVHSSKVYSPFFGFLFAILSIWAFFSILKQANKTYILFFAFYILSFAQQIIWAFYSSNPSKYFTYLGVWYGIGGGIIMFGGMIIEKLLMYIIPLCNLLIRTKIPTNFQNRNVLLELSLIIPYSLWMMTYVLFF